MTTLTEISPDLLVEFRDRNETVRCRRLHVVIRGFRCDEGPGVELDCGEDVAITLSL